MTRPSVAMTVMAANPSARPQRSIAFPIGSLHTPPMILLRVLVTETSACSEKSLVTYAVRLLVTCC